MKKNKYKRIPYGQSNYESVATNNFYYVDKTHFIEKIEDYGSRFLFFMRPRRFGKSLFLSTLHHYYDINRKDQFNELFGHTYIGKNPTGLQNTYPVLFLSFSGVQSYGTIEDTITAFYYRIRADIEVFLKLTQERINFLDKEINEILSITEPSIMLDVLIKKLSVKKKHLYVMIDEYDNFGNIILTEHGKEKYEKLTHGAGFLRNFFAVIKEGTLSNSIERLFITGVSPLVMADVSSGFNIGDNISLFPELNALAGFTQKETENLIDYYVEKTIIKKEDRDKSLQIIKDNYNSYKFSEKATETIINSDMVLYFVKEYIARKEIPIDIIDENIRTDYGKIKLMIVKSNQLNGNFNLISQILTEKETTAELVKAFQVKDLIQHNSFISLFYYLGFLTIKKIRYSNYVTFRIPNKVIEKIMWDYVRKAVNQTYKLKIHNHELLEQFYEMAVNGTWQPALDYILTRFYEAISVRDFTLKEVGTKAFLLAYFNLSPFFTTQSETESNKGFIDIFIKPVVEDYEEQAKYFYFIELKYLKSEEINTETKKNAAIKNATKNAVLQLEQYSEKFNNKFTKKIIIILSAKELLKLEEIK